ncbi:MAG: HD domain-containing protein, partial [Lachnospiraceae bacterium]|nr:HD domain-containing protein [Lachnospiraceae bacterium]
IRDCYRTGLTKVFMPEYDAIVGVPQNNPHHCYDVEEHTLKVLENTPPDKVIRLAALFHDMGKPVCHTVDERGIDHFHGHQAVSEELSKKILKRLKSDNDTISKVCRFVLYHDVRTEAERRQVRRLINRIGAENIEGLLALQTADTMAQSDYMRADKLRRIEELRSIAEDIKRSGEAVNLKGLAVDGNDLKALGYKPGRTLGAALKKLLDDVLEDPSLNTREYLLGEAERLKTRGEQ